MDLPKVWLIFGKVLQETCSKYGLQVHNLVLMSNHFHMVLSTPQANISDGMWFFLSQTSKRLGGACGRINHCYGERYFWSLLDSAAGFAYAMKYVSRNPVRAGLSRRVEDYPFSTVKLDGAVGFPLTERIDSCSRMIPRDFAERLEWMNLPTPKEKEALIKTALRRAKFRFSPHKNLRRSLRNLTSAYAIDEIPLAEK